MSLPTPIDHVELMLNRLLSQWDDSSNIKGMIQSYAERLNGLEDVFFQLLNNRGIYTAVGAQLDIIGELFGVRRLGRIDDQYRAAILQKITTSGTDGTTEVFMDVLRTISDSSFVDFWEHHSGDVHARLGEGFGVNTYPDIQDLVPAGVNLRIYVDDKFDSFVGAEITTTAYDLDTNGQGVIEVESGQSYDLQVQKQGTNSTTTTNAILPEINDDSFNNVPTAELLFSRATTISGKIVDDLGNFIVDDQGSNILWLDYSF